MSVLIRHAVRHTLEFDRIFKLPRRDWRYESQYLTQQISDWLRRPGAGMTLFPIQAVALKEAWENQGLVAPIGVGGGKTLTSLLLPKVLESQRPLLVIPAKLIDKTRLEWQEYAKSWDIPNWLKIQSYELLGRVQAKEDLERYNPDLLIFDEAHKLKNPKAAVTRRVKRFIKERRKKGLSLRVCAMSGTFTQRSLKDYGHIVEWCLPNGSPMPREWAELEDWANALDDLANPLARVDPGALLYLVGPEDVLPGDFPDSLTTVRRAYGRRLVDTPGVVSSGSEVLGTSLQISALEAKESAAIDQCFALLRNTATLPDGWECIDGVEVWRAARQLALGFYYVWDPRPPLPWLIARSAWAKFAREAIKNSSHSHKPLDSEYDVQLNHPDAPELLDWLKIRDTFTPNPVPVWVCDSALVAAARWAQDHPKGIVWVEHVGFGLALEALTGLPYFSEMGLDRTGRMIELASGPVIAAVGSNRDGRNLQAWNANFIVSSPSSGLHYEQLLGRTHRTGQKADEVTAEVYMGCIEHAEAWEKACSSARYEQDSTRAAMRLCYADISIEPNKYHVKRGPRWQKD